MEINEFGKEHIAAISARIQGRLAYEESNCNYLAWAISRAGHGDHLEIGTLHGGSAILALLVKMELGLAGDVYCVDPLNGYYIGTPYGCPVDLVTKVPINANVVLENAAAFGVVNRLHLISQKSMPFPVSIQNHRFVSAYIDGDHEGETPTLDWWNCQSRTSKVVVFDNYDERHPAVQDAVRTAATTQGWALTMEGPITAVLEKATK